MYLVTAADTLDPPRYYALTTDNGVADEWLSGDRKKPAFGQFSYEQDRSVWSNGNLLNVVNTSERSQLYICAFWLGEVIAAVASRCRPAPSTPIHSSI